MTRLFLIILVVLFLFPLYWMIEGSLQDIRGIMLMPPRLIPHEPSLDNYRVIFGYASVGPMVANTFLISAAVIVLGAVVTMMGAYALAHHEFRGRKAVLWFAAASLIVPRAVMLLPLFIVTRNLGLSGTRWAAIIPHLYFPLGLLVATAYLRMIPRSLIESARMDGAGELTIATEVIAPAARPLVGVLALFLGLAAQGDFVWQMLQLRRESIQTLSVGLLKWVSSIASSDGNVVRVNPIGLHLAVGVVLFVPMVVVFVTCQRQLRAGMTVGAVKE